MSLETGGSPIFRGLMQERYGASPDLASPALQAALYQEEHAIAARRAPSLETTQQPAEASAPLPYQRQLGLQEAPDGWEPLYRDTTPPSAETMREMVGFPGLLRLLALSDHPKQSSLAVLARFQETVPRPLEERAEPYPYLHQEPAW